MFLRSLSFKILIGLGVLAPLFSLTAQNLSFGWDPSNDPNVVNYTIYYGTESGVYPNAVRVGNVTTATLSNLVQGITYYFAATTTDTAGMESDYSQELSYVIPLPSPAVVSIVASANGQLTINVSGATNQNCIVEASTDLATWIPVATNTVPFIFTDTATRQFPQRFYRTRTVSF